MKKIEQSRCVVCGMRVQVNAKRNKHYGAEFGYATQLEWFTEWGHSRYPMDHPATPNRKAIKWFKKGLK
jgi:hypothetical protein